CRYGTWHTAGDDWVILYPDMRTVTFQGGSVTGWEGNGANFWFGLNTNFYNRDNPLGGINVNYGERRLLWTIRWVIENYNIDPDRVHIQGSSMGGFGTLNLALRYPELFASAFARVPNVDFFRMSPYADSICVMHWGTREANIPTNEGIGTYDRMDLVKFVRDHPEVDFPVIMTLNGKQDRLVGWDGPRLFFEAMQETGHELIAFWSTGGHAGPQGPETGVPPEHYEIDLKRLRRNESYPAISFASTNQDPGTSPEDGAPAGQLNAVVDWRDVIDRPGEYGVTLEPLHGRQFAATASVTPRRLQSFRVEPGKTYNFVNVDLATGRTVQQGPIKPDAANLLTVKEFKVGFPGNRLIIIPAGR
ncbi:MAG TPA: prolyl oligopeptidase family serine peptidase, partial [Candidatus Glassbacteria bacterium]|nr:prolyl oligopeptidase family serine peptidase [Candidatus Glassbacteria bacterium]